MSKTGPQRFTLLHLLRVLLYHSIWIKLIIHENTLLPCNFWSSFSLGDQIFHTTLLILLIYSASKMTLPLMRLPFVVWVTSSRFPNNHPYFCQNRKKLWQQILIKDRFLLGQYLRWYITNMHNLMRMFMRIIWLLKSTCNQMQLLVKREEYF